MVLVILTSNTKAQGQVLCRYSFGTIFWNSTRVIVLSKLHRIMEMVHHLHQVTKACGLKQL